MERWMVKNIKYDLNNLRKNLNISDILARLLVNRGIYKIEEAKEFLNPKIEYFNETGEMKDLNNAIELIKKNIDRGCKILIVGDYDVDGVISTYVLYKGLKRVNANVTFHIPDRIKEGYGINEEIIKKAKVDRVDLIITCDNGISAIEQLKLAKEMGMSVIVTDHHDILFKNQEDDKREYIVPEVDCVVNPKQFDCNYPFKGLCGAGVVYKIGRAHV